MAPSKRDRSKRAASTVSPRQTPIPSTNEHQPNSMTERTGNEEHNKDIFIDIEATTSSQPLVVSADVPSKINIKQQVEDEATETNAQSTDTTTVDIERHVKDTVKNISSAPMSTSTCEIEDEQSLSANVTRLNTPNGAEVILIGTAHFSLKSVQDVQRVIRSVRPSSVVLELCHERAFMLSVDEQSLLEQSKSLTIEKARSVIADKGITEGLIYMMFIKMSASLTQKLGIAPGSEFRAASTEAQKIPGCRVVLADRPLRVTIARAVASLSMWQKMKLIYRALISDVNITQEEVENFKDEDMLGSLFDELGDQFPDFKRVLLDERNMFLAHSIYHLAQHFEARLGPQRLVAVVGIAHVAGIVENWAQTSEEQIRSYSLMPETSMTTKVVTKTIKYCAFALFVYAGYRVLTPTNIQSIIRQRLVGS